jgi:hypothetical protein
MGRASRIYRVEQTRIEILCRKPEGMTTLERARRKWDDIKVDLN